MRTISFKALSAILLLPFFLVGCQPKTESKAPVPDNVVMNDRVFDAKTLLDKDKLAASRPITRHEFNLLSISAFDSSASPLENGFKYYLLDSLFSGKQTKMIVLVRAYAEENTAWIVAFDNGKFMDAQIVYQDNSEGFYSIESSIHDNIIKTVIRNDFADSPETKKKTSSFHWSADHHFTVLRDSVKK